MSGWRLPATNTLDSTLVDDGNRSWIGTKDRGRNISAPGTLYAGSTASEMAYMFYITLGNRSYCDPFLSTTSTCSGPQTGWGLTKTGPFSNLQARFYWSATAGPSVVQDGWGFDFEYGSQGTRPSDLGAFAWAVHDGDVGVVPIPAAVWLLSSGLIGLIGVARRRKS